MSAFGQAKPLASLSSTLLARKGQAKPAMRPQGFGGFGTMPGAADDLGWNDMGAPEEPVTLEAPVVSAVPEPAVPIPAVLVQRDVLRDEIATPSRTAAPAPRAIVTKPISVATATRIGRETRQQHNPKGQRSKARDTKARGTKAQGRTAFTLRLDQDRHLRLRLASALQTASAQVLVTEALDQYLNTLPQVDALIAQLPAPAKR